MPVMTMTSSTKSPARFRFQPALEPSLSHRDQTVIIAMGVMGKMQVPIHQEIRMVAVRHGFVAAIRAVGV